MRHRRPRISGLRARCRSQCSPSPSSSMPPLRACALWARRCQMSRRCQLLPLLSLHQLPPLWEHLKLVGPPRGFSKRRTSLNEIRDLLDPQFEAHPEGRMQVSAPEAYYPCWRGAGCSTKQPQTMESTIHKSSSWGVCASPVSPSPAPGEFVLASEKVRHWRAPLSSPSVCLLACLDRARAAGS